MNRRQLQLDTVISSSLILLLLAAYVHFGNQQQPHNSAALSLRAAGMLQLPEPAAVPVLEFESTEGGTFSTRQFRDKWYLLYFGYTFCPDICPTSLAEMLQIRRMLDEQALEQVEFVMVTVDPERDTATQLRAYLDFFDPQFKGLSGSMDSIQSLSNALGIPFIPGDSSQPGYTVDHSGNLAIISPQGMHFGFVQAPFKIKAVAQQLNLLVQTTE